MTAAGTDTGKSGARGIVAVFGALCALTAAELLVPGLAAGRSLRIGLLVALLLGKVALVSLFFLRVRANRRWNGLLVVAVVLAVGFAIVLMLESWYRGGLQ
jgi:hypothetical protein